MSRIRNPDWENDEKLKADIQKYVLQNLTRREVLDFLGRDYPQLCVESSNAESKDGSLWGEICRLRNRPESRRKSSQRRNQWTRTTLGVPINAQKITRAPPFGSTTKLGVRCHDADWPWRFREPRKSWTKEATQGDEWHIYITGKITVSAIFFHRLTKNTWSRFASLSLTYNMRARAWGMRGMQGKRNTYEAQYVSFSV